MSITTNSRKNSFFRVSLIDRYIIKELLPVFFFGVVVFSIVGELIGISFEQVRFIVNQGLSISTSAHIHLLKLPTFIVISLPFAILLSTNLTYNRLSENREILALQSVGISLYQLVMPAVAMGLIVSVLMFLFNEFIVPSTNYKVAITLEQSMNVDRTNLRKYNKKDIIYPEFAEKKSKQLTKQSQIKRLFFAERFKEEEMTGVTVLVFDDGSLKEIVTSESGKWSQDKELWQLSKGTKNTIKDDGSYGVLIQFEELFLDLPINIFNYAKNNRDFREMNIFQLYQQLTIIKPTRDSKKILELKICIQERKALPFSCIIFAFLGSAIGINPQPKPNSNGFGITVIIIFSYYFLQFFTTALATAEIIPIFFGIWLPNLALIIIGFICIKAASATSRL